MGTFFKLFIIIMTMSTILFIVFPSETQLIRGGFFDTMIDSNTGVMNNSFASWTEQGTEDTGFFQKFIDGLSVIKKLVITLINFTTVPIALANNLEIPQTVRLLFFLPLSLLYGLATLLILIRGVNA